MLKGSTQIVDLRLKVLVSEFPRLWILWRHEYDVIDSRDVVES